MTMLLIVQFLLVLGLAVAQSEYKRIASRQWTI